MIQKLLNIAAETDMFLTVFMLVMVGLRRGELLTLHWSDIDFDNNILKVRRNMVKGEKYKKSLGAYGRFGQEKGIYLLGIHSI